VIHDDGTSRMLDEGFFAWIDGVEEWVTVRGRDAGNPVLLMIHGTGYALSQMAPLFAPWEAHFTLVQWDQPGPVRPGREIVKLQQTTSRSTGSCARALPLLNWCIAASHRAGSSSSRSLAERSSG
jgi:hypothetical protein